MSHCFKIPNQFADVFIWDINQERNTISYEVRDKDTGILSEPARTTKFVVDETKGMVYYDQRFIEISLFLRAYNTLM